MEILNNIEVYEHQYQRGLTEDGEPDYGYSFAIVAYSDYGHEFVYKHAGHAETVHPDRWMADVSYEEVDTFDWDSLVSREEAKAKTQAEFEVLMNKIFIGTFKWNEEDWRYVRTCYASQAWQDEDCEYHEIMREREAG